VIGLYESLRRQHFLSALLWTLCLGGVLPLLLPVVTLIPYVLAALMGQGGLYRYGTSAAAARLVFAALFQVGTAVVCGYLLHRNLTRRSFALERSAES
jgi:hypothetical protein